MVQAVGKVRQTVEHSGIGIRLGSDWDQIWLGEENESVYDGLALVGLAPSMA